MNVNTYGTDDNSNKVDAGNNGDGAPENSSSSSSMLSSIQAKVMKHKKALQYSSLFLSIALPLYVGLRDERWDWFDYHPLAMMIGWVALVINGIVFKKIPGKQNTIIHMYLMSASAIFVALGWYVIHTNKNMKGKPHFTTNHGIMGILLIVVMLISSLFSYIGLNPDTGIFRANKSFRTIHKWGLRLIIFLAWYECHEGYEKIGLDSLYDGGFMILMLCLTPVLLL